MWHQISSEIKIEPKIICKNYVPLVSFILFISIITYLFFLRPPIVLVTDVYFETLYGVKKGQLEQLKASFRVFRQIKKVYVGEDTSNLTIIDSVEKSYFAPFCVFFPFWYKDAAAAYSQKHTASKTYVFLDNNNAPQDASSVIYIRSDTENDYYRMGRFAAALSNESGVKDDGHKKILFIYDIDIESAEESAFNKGLAAGGFLGGSDFIKNNEFQSVGNVSCVVVQGPAASFLNAGTSVPAIVRAWFLNPKYVPNNIKVQIDDSPYCLIPKINVYKNKKGNTLQVPADFIILYDKILNKKITRDLRKAKNSSLGDKTKRAS
jgi:hypothetical protein